MAIKLNFSFPVFGLWFKRTMTLLAICLLPFGAYSFYKWVNSGHSGIYKIGMDSNWYPLALHGKQHCMTAFTIDLLSSIAKDQSVKMDVVRIGHNRLTEVMDDKFVDGILTILLPDRKLEEKYYFSEPYYRYGAVLVAKNGSTIRSVQDLDKKRLGVIRSSSVLYRLQLSKCQVSVVPYDDFQVMLKALSENKVDAVVMDQVLLYLYFGANYRNELKIVTKPLTNEGLRLVTRKNPEGLALIEKFNTSLIEIKSTSHYDFLLTKWDIYDPEVIIP